MTTQTAPYLADSLLDPDLFIRAQAMLDDDNREISARQEIVKNVRRALRENERRRELFEALVQAEIATLTKADGKPAYSDAEARTAALRQRLGEDAGYADLLADGEALKRTIDENSVEIEAHARRRQDVHALLSYAAAWLRYHASEAR